MSSIIAFMREHAAAANKVDTGEHHLLLTWLIFTGLLLFGIFISWQEGLLPELYETDKSKLSYAITLIYIIVTFHCVARINRVSNESNEVKYISRFIRDNPDTEIKLDADNTTHLSGYGKLNTSYMSSYLRDLVYQHRAESRPDDASANRDLIEVYAAKLKGPQEIGWFATDIMLKLGLLGTIIGFIMMLGSVANVKDFDVSTMQKILQLMSSGMGTALYTTMAGLTASMLAAAQYYMLDRSADTMLESMQHVSEVCLKPSLRHRNIELPDS